MRGALAWALAGLGALCLALTGAGLAAGARPLVVRTGSMAPAFPVGAVVLAQPEPAVRARVGQVVAVVRTDGRRIMHRVVRMRRAGDGAVTLVLRGDRNRAADPPVTVRQVERPLLAVPALGRPVVWLGGRWVQFWLGVGTGVLAVAWLARRERRRARRPAPAATAPTAGSARREALRA
jgi:signal peptidase I